jgi:hypothetical protein
VKAATPQGEQRDAAGSHIASESDGELPNERGADEVERRRQSELSSQRDANEDATEPQDSTDTERSPAGSGPPPHSVADQAKENERRAEVDGRELPA